ncbi:hypothetical protein MMC08_008821 [Hypocenomyce scalaris]|nr:hypothetical protein [Hypocenomyce scalaris]
MTASPKTPNKCKTTSSAPQSAPLMENIKSLQSSSLTSSQGLAFTSAPVLPHPLPSPPSVSPLSAPVPPPATSARPKKAGQPKKMPKSKMLEWKKSALASNPESVRLASKFPETQPAILAEYIGPADTQAVHEYLHNSPAATGILSRWRDARNTGFGILDKAKASQWTLAAGSRLDHILQLFGFGT